jgi:hypothetical protein
MYGQVIGVTNMKAFTTGVEGICFAIPTSVVRPVVDALIAEGQVKGRPSIGITVGPLSESAKEYYDLPSGLYIDSVAEGSDAEAKGVQSGDVLTAVNGETVTTTYEVNAIKEAFSVGDTMTLTIYRDGETESSFIRNLGSTNADTTFALSTYWDSEWIAYSTDKNFEILSGKYPSIDKPTQSLKSLYKTTLDFAPKQISVNQDQRIIALSADSNYFSYDIENRRHFTFSADIPISRINWLDNFLIWHRNNNKIVVRDFDGNNRRELISNIDNDLPVIISANNKWLYYFDVSEKTISDTSGQSNSSDSTPETYNMPMQPADSEAAAPTAQIIYTLKRSSL